VLNLSKHTALAERAEIASNFWTRGVGLLGRSDWSRADGLIIRPCSSIHCLFMTLTIDAVFVGSDDLVLRLAPGLRPWTLGVIAPGAQYVIELPPGTLARAGTEQGDRVVIEIAPDPGAPTASK